MFWVRSSLDSIQVDIPVSRLIWMAATRLSNGRARINMAPLISQRRGLSAAPRGAWCCAVEDIRKACQHISSGSSHVERLPVFSQIMQVSVPYVETEHPRRCIIKMSNATYLTMHARQRAKDASLVSTWAFEETVDKKRGKDNKTRQKDSERQKERQLKTWLRFNIYYSSGFDPSSRILTLSCTFWTFRLKRWISNGCFITYLISIIYATLGGETKLSTLSFAG